MRLPRLPRGLRAAAELGRRDHLRDPERAGGLSAQGAGLPLRGGRALPDRSHAPRLCRPQQLSRRPGLREKPARPPARQELRGQDRAVIDPKQAAVSKDIKPGVEPHEGSNTTHYSIADKDGNAVSVTYTLNDWFGARV